MSKLESQLKRYLDRRNLERSGKPFSSGAAGNGEPEFVIQKHGASSLLRFSLTLIAVASQRFFIFPPGKSELLWRSVRRWSHPVLKRPQDGLVSISEPFVAIETCLKNPGDASL